MSSCVAIAVEALEVCSHNPSSVDHVKVLLNQVALTEVHLRVNMELHKLVTPLPLPLTPSLSPLGSTRLCQVYEDCHEVWPLTKSHLSR